MKKPIQLNINHEWVTSTRQQHRFYSIFGGSLLSNPHRKSRRNTNFRKDMTARHQLDLIYRQIRGGKDKAICICASIAKGGGNNSVTYIVELYNKD